MFVSRYFNTFPKGEGSNLPFLFAILRSDTTLSRVRALCPSFDDPLELDESDESLSDPLEPDEPFPCELKKKNESLKSFQEKTTFSIASIYLNQTSWNVSVFANCCFLATKRRLACEVGALEEMPAMNFWLTFRFWANRC